MSTPAFSSPEEQQAAYARVNAATTPSEYAAAAAAAGLTGDAQALATGGAQPVQVPSFEEQLAASQQANAALQAQINAMGDRFKDALAGLQSQMQGVIASVPQKVDPVTESAGKVVAHFKGLAASDAKNGLHSALVAHLTALGLAEVAKIL
jgi:hypothetical protein